MDDCKLNISPVVRLRRMNETFVYFIDFLVVASWVGGGVIKCESAKARKCESEHA